MDALLPGFISFQDLASRPVAPPTGPVTLGNAAAATPVATLEEAAAHGTSVFMQIRPLFERMPAAGDSQFAFMVKFGLPVEQLNRPAQNPAGDAFVIVGDDSGSMSGNLAAILRAAAIALPAKLAPEDSFACVRFGNYADVISPLTRANADLTTYEASINTNFHGSRGGTNTTSGIQLALTMAEQAARPVTMLLFTDGGDDNPGPPNNPTLLRNHHTIAPIIARSIPAQESSLVAVSLTNATSAPGLPRK